MRVKDDFFRVLGCFCTWALIASLPQSVLPAQIYVAVTCILLVLAAPSAAGLLGMTLLVFSNTKRTPLLRVSEFLMQFAVSIDAVLKMIPHRWFAEAYRRHLLFLAIVLGHQEMDKDCERVLDELVKLIKKEAGKSSEEMISPMSMLVGALRNRGKHEESIKVALELLAVLGNQKKHQLTVGTTLSDVAATYAQLGRSKEAIDAGLRSVQILRELQSKGSFAAVTVLPICLNNLGYCYEYACDYKRAAQAYEESLELKLKAFGEQSKEVAVAYSNVSAIYLEEERYAEALEAAKKAVDLLKRNDEPETRVWASTITNLGDAYRGLSKFEEAEKYLKEAIEIKEKVLEKDDTHLGEGLHCLARLYADKGDYDLADKYFRESGAIFRRKFPADHPKLAKAVGHHCQALRKCGRDHEADDLEQELVLKV